MPADHPTPPPSGLDACRHHVLDHALDIAPLRGWNVILEPETIATMELNPILVSEAFPRGTVDLLRFFCADGDRRMEEAWTSSDAQQPSMTQRVTQLTRLRLSVDQRHREAVRRMLAYYVMPPHCSEAPLTLMASVDKIWNLAGDRATDINYYTKRLLLAGVLSATTLFWIDDSSPDGENTTRFLKHRIDEALSLGRLSSRALEALTPWRHNAA